MGHVDVGKRHARTNSPACTERHEVEVRGLVASRWFQESGRVELVRSVVHARVPLDSVDVEDLASSGREIVPRHPRLLTRFVVDGHRSARLQTRDLLHYCPQGW